jgi:IS605 OrfB family transposase
MSLVIQKIKAPEAFCPRLEELVRAADPCVRQMLAHRELSSSKYYKEIPCVLAKSLIAKYQRNSKCQKVQNLVLPVCGDKGKQIKLGEKGIRIPAFFKKESLPVTFLHPVDGFIRNAEFFHRRGQWYAAICYTAPSAKPIKPEGCIGVDRNSVGNVAVLADPQNGKVRVLGPSAASFKYNFRRRKARLLSQGRRRQVSKLRKKQSRRTTYENHRTSKAIVDYAQTHCRAIAIEDLKGVSAEQSKIAGYTKKHQWAFAQLEGFIRYKASLAGVPVIGVDPAYTSQECSRCGQCHKPRGKIFLCPSCLVKQHRDANSGFVIAQRGNDILSGVGAGVENVAPAGPIGGPLSGKEVICHG